MLMWFYILMLMLLSIVFQGHYRAPDLHTTQIWTEMATWYEDHSEGITGVGEG
jgi:hypothetical protein